MRNFSNPEILVEQVIELVLSVNHNAIRVIKSTISVGFTKSVRKK